ncbi:AAA family ATPase [Chitinophagaceae bacterium IBVUCB2]|nr:AAA family ATPase [Chitinophagaceae bacterium IBVUCB2]
MQLQVASRKRAKIKLAFQGPSGSGKTYSSLLLAYGLCGDWSKIAVIDTENHSAELYSNLGQYNTMDIGAPYTPERYIEAIKLCENSGIQVIIIDSISHEWEGSGGILDIHSSMVGNSFTNWSKLTPRHNNFIQAILHSPCHIIGTIRSKQDYVLNEKNGKMIPEKVGLKGVTRDGLDYEMTIVFNIDIKNNVIANKDRTGLFTGKPEFKVTTETGKTILAWCNSGEEVTEVLISTEDRIKRCSTIQELLELYHKQTLSVQKEFASQFTQKRTLLVTTNQTISELPKPSTNGKHTHS